MENRSKVVTEHVIELLGDSRGFEDLYESFDDEFRFHASRHVDYDNSDKQIEFMTMLFWCEDLEGEARDRMSELLRNTKYGDIRALYGFAT